MTKEELEDGLKDGLGRLVGAYRQLQALLRRLEQDTKLDEKLKGDVMDTLSDVLEFQITPAEDSEEE